ncbi:hypothetical protein THAOC_16314 [Thalassiosira oceanica]|uniref:Uncharacterized protein n=1 Tax=Thalassiosira oceanica TaxID=159749 RepID=K0SDK7_THAOC|nr:hypothetical protein THAOC_16314 [Thalassiosira oceanica]|eukprot:EJK63054.1 hypothetical protein THAOC_16314 [Thalassiosira oceanica]
MSSSPSIHKTACDTLHNKLNSLREATPALAHLPEQERFANTAFELEFQKAALQRKIDSAHEFLIQKGVNLLDSQEKKTSPVDNSSEPASPPAIGARVSDDSSRSGSLPRPSFFFNGDKMPSRWMAREQARDRLAEEENHCSTGGPTDRSVGEDDDSILQDLVSRKGSEIVKLERKAESVTVESADMRAEMSSLQARQDATSESFNEELAALTHEIKALERENEELTHRLVENTVHADERKIYIDILSKELKAAREKLEVSQRVVDSQEREIKRDHRTRQRGKYQTNFKRDSSYATDMSAVSFDSSDMIDILDVELNS